MPSGSAVSRWPDGAHDGRRIGIVHVCRPLDLGARFAGGYYLYTRADLGTGAALAANGSSWAALSDVNAKENFRDVDGEGVLAKLAAMSIREWNYKAQDAAIRHMGPTAQEFRAAFGLGDFPLRINTVDADGVALAAVKALDARTRALPERAATLEAENAALSARLNAAEVEIAGLRERLDRLERTPHPLMPQVVGPPRRR